MNTWLEINRANGSVDKRRVTENHMLGEVAGLCPGCGAIPFRVKCHAPQLVDDYTIKAGARCVDCGDPVGWVFHKPSTLFGLHEDAMAMSRVRVY